MVVLLLMGGASPASASTRYVWLPSERVSQTEGSFLSSMHSVAASGSTIHLVHPIQGGGSLPASVSYQRSLDAGASWSPERVLFRTGGRLAGTVGNLAIAARGQSVTFAFRTHDADAALLFTRTSRDGGDTWGRRVLVARITTPLLMGIPAVAISSAGIFVAWSDRSSGAVSIRRSDDGGDSYGPATRLGVTRHDVYCGDPPFVDGLVGLAARGRNVQVVWSQSPSGSCFPNVLLLRRSTDGGDTYQPRQTLSDSPTHGWPQLATRGDIVLIIVGGWAGKLLLFRSEDSGATFRRSVAGPLYGTFTQDVAIIAAGLAMITFSRPMEGGNALPGSELLYRQSSDDGQTWSDPAIAFSRPGRYATSPNLVFADGLPVIVHTIGPHDLSDFDIGVVRAIER